MQKVGRTDNVPVCKHLLQPHGASLLVLNIICAVYQRLNAAMLRRISLFDEALMLKKDD